MSDLGVAIFGAGRAVHGHAHAIAQTAGARLVAVFDVHAERAADFAETHGCQAATSSEDVLKGTDMLAAVERAGVQLLVAHSQR
jgi:predicted dehydrogenase